MKSSLLNRVEKTIQKAKEHSEQFSEYSFLWVNNRKKFLGRSMLYFQALVQVQAPIE